VTTYVALLRGINVGGRHRVPMAELRALFETQGLERVSTYIQSGNVLFASAEREAALLPALSAALEGRFGFVIPLVLREAAELERTAAAGHPLADAQLDERMLHVAFLGAAPAPEAVAAFDAAAFLPDELAVAGREVHIAYAQGSARSKLNVDAIERAFGGPATARNWRTVSKLAELAAAVPH
jgi:uncharacterized protein (DUF1697 family)